MIQSVAAVTYCMTDWNEGWHTLMTAVHLTLEAHSVKLATLRAETQIWTLASLPDLQLI